MRRTKRTVIPVLAAAFSMVILACCAARGGSRMATAEGLRCPGGYTMTCEVRKIGRIHHGTFRKNYDSCSCVPNSMDPQTTPVIPSF